MKSQNEERFIDEDKKMKLTSEKLIESLKVALEKFYCEDSKYPIVSHNNGKQERACSHRIAYFLQNAIGDEFIVDCEYDMKWNRKEYTSSSYLRPDIIIHKRCYDEYYAVIEVKVDESENEKDFDKLKILTNDKPDVIGIFLGLWENGNCEVSEFRDGAKVREKEWWRIRSHSEHGS